MSFLLFYNTKMRSHQNQTAESNSAEYKRPSYLRRTIVPRTALQAVCSLWVVLVLSTSVQMASASDISITPSIESTCGIQTSPNSKKCAILSVLPFDEYGSKKRQPLNPKELPFGHMASVLMAVKHFNAKNSYIVPELGNEFYGETCKVEMPLHCHQTSFIAAIRNDDAVIRPNNALIKLEREEKIGEKELCGIIGPYSFKTMDSTPIIAMAWEIPLISYFPTDFMIGRNHRRAGTAAITAEVDEKAEMMMEYILKHRERNYVVLIYHATELSFISDGFYQAVSRLNKEENKFEFISFGVDVKSEESYREVMEEIKKLGWKTIIGAFPRPDQWERLFVEVEAQNMTPRDNGYVWYSFETSDLEMFTMGNNKWTPRGKDETVRWQELRANILSGAGYFRVLDGFEEDMKCGDDKHEDGAHRFLCSWKNMTSSDVAMLKDMHPVKEWPQKSTGKYIAEDDYFQKENPPPYSAFVYDSVIALGMAKCREIYLNERYKFQPRKKGPPGIPHYPYTNQDSRFYNELALNTTFDGATGSVVLHNNNFYTRSASTLTFGIYNIRATNWPTDQNFDETSFEYVLTSIKKPGQNWKDIEKNKFIYADGTSNEPENFKLPVAVDEKFPYWAIVVIVCVSCLSILGVAAIFFGKKAGDSVWMVERSELEFADPPQVLGSGAFGLVLLAEYRGTQVATKQVLPPRMDKKRNKNRFSTKDEENNLGKASAVTVDLCGSLELGSEAFNPSQSARHYKRLRQDFLVEMRQLSKLRHPCIATVMGAVMGKDEEPMLVMEYMENGSLYDLLRNDTISLEGDLLLPILRDISQGIRFLHAASPVVIHGDLKAKNVLVDNKFRAKVTDFGLSQEKSNKSNISARGTPYWMAPELLRNECENNTQTDVYAFGMILCEIYSRQDPYEDEDYNQVLKLVTDPAVNKRPPVPASCPPQVQSMLRDCLEGDPVLRPTMEEVDIRLKRLNVETTAGTVLQFSKQRSKSQRRLSQRTEELLYDVFPPHIAKAMQAGKKVEPESREVVTIFFSDIVGFTNISSTLTPIKVSDMLDRLYNKFDDLSRKYDVFKVETIGDAYMAVTNLVKDQAHTHAKLIADFSIDALKAANETLVDKDDRSKGYVHIRVGFHSGPVVANVVGSRNPRYCLFGDTVNTASRMESNSLKNRIHCSEIAESFLRAQSPRMPVTSRGLVPIKGKGEMHTFWVNE